MINQETAAALWECHREIATAIALLDDMQKALGDYPDKEARNQPTLRDAFGRKRNLQLGIPSGDSCHRLFNVSPLLAESVIRAHIADKRAELARMNEQARIELAMPAEAT